MTSIPKFRFNRWFPEFEQESDSQIWKNFGAGYLFKNFRNEAKSENVTPGLSGI